MWSQLVVLVCCVAWWPFAVAAQAGPAGQDPPGGPWRTVREKDRITDAESVYVLKPSNEAVQVPLALGKPAALVIFCGSGEAFVMVGFPMALEPDSMSGAYRFDTAPGVGAIWRIRRNQPWVLELWQSHAEQLFQREDPVREFIVRVEFRNGQQVTVSFDVRGLREAVRPLGGACPP